MEAIKNSQPSYEELFAENQRLKAQIASGHEFFAGVLEAQDEMIVRWRPNGDRVYANAQYCKTFHVDPSTVAGTKFESVIHPSDVAKWLEQIEKLTPESNVHRATHRVVLPSGQVAYQEWSDVAIFDDKGNVREYQSVGRDVTERAKQDLLLKKAASLKVDTCSDMFFQEVTSELSGALNTALCLIGYLQPDKRAVKVLATTQSLSDNCPEYYELEGTPCATVVQTKKPCVHPENLDNLFPQDNFLVAHKLKGYCGAPLLDVAGEVIGIIILLFREPINSPTTVLNYVKIFASRVAGEIERRNTEGLFRSIVEDSPMLVNMLDLDGRVIDVNGMTQRHPDELISAMKGNLIQEHPHIMAFPENQTNLNRALENARNGVADKFSGATPDSFREDGSLAPEHLTYFEAFLNPVKDSTGQVSNILMSCYDTTTQSLLAIRSEQKLILDRVLVDVAADIINAAETEVSRHIRKALKALRTFFNFTACSYVKLDERGVGRLDVVEMESAEMVDRYLGLEFDTHQMRHMVDRYRNKMFEPLVIYLDEMDDASPNKAPMQEAGFKSMLEIPLVIKGEIKGILALNSTERHWFDDIQHSPSIFLTARILTSALAREQLGGSLALSKRRYKNLVEHIPGVVYRRQIKNKCVFEYVSNESKNVLGVSPSALLSGEVHLSDLCHHEDLPNLVSAVEGAINGTRRFAVEYRICKPDGTTAWVIERGKIYPEQGVDVIYGTIFDITKMKSAQEALSSLDQKKNEFIAIAAHELRTPLASIMGYSEALLRGDEFGGWSEEQQSEFLRMIHSRGESLSELIDTLLDVSKIQKSDDLLLIKAKEAKICPVVEEAVKYMQALHPDTPFVYNDRCEKIECDAEIDPERMRQAIDNLLVNAVKYSPKGSPITIKTECQPEDCLVSVIDKGIGIPSEHLEKIFERFFRVDSSLTAVSGMGVGLSLVKDIVEAHDGEVWAENNLDQGSTFKIKIPKVYI